MDKKIGILNIIVSIFFKIILLFGSILVRRFLIQNIGNDANGLSSLYLSIVGFLTVTELGIGEAITFCMYKPIVENDKNKVAALYGLFKKIYLIIGGIILLAGLAVMPFLPNLAKDYSNIDANIFLTFVLTLMSVVITYAYSAKLSLINAYKYNYISTSITSLGTLVEHILKIAIIIITKSFEAYLICRIIAVLIQWIAANYFCKKKFGDIIAVKNAEIDKESKVQIINNIKAMFMHKIGNVLVNTADSVIISAFVGVVALGIYSNYTTIMLSMTGVLTLFFYPLTSVVGHAFVNESKENMRKSFNVFYGINYVLGTVFCLGYYAIIDNVVSICFGDNLQVDRSIAFVITLNYFIQFMRTSTLMFRSSTGTFYNDRYKPLVEGLVNVILSILLVKYIGITGVIIATIATNLFICDIVEPHVVYKYALNTKATAFYITNYSYICVFILCLLIVQKFMVSRTSLFSEFFINGSIAVAVAMIPLLVLWLTNKDFRECMQGLVAKIVIKHKL